MGWKVVGVGVLTALSRFMVLQLTGRGSFPIHVISHLQEKQPMLIPILLKCFVAGLLFFPQDVLESLLCFIILHFFHMPEHPGF